MSKYINFNNLRKKKGFASGVGCGGQVKLTFVETQKTTRKTQKEEREKTKNNLFYEQ